MNEGNGWAIFIAGLFGAVVLLSAWGSSHVIHKETESRQAPANGFRWTVRAGALALLTILTLVASLVKHWVAR